MLYWVGSHCSNSRVQIFNIGMILEDAMKVKIYWYQTQSLNPIKSQLNSNFYNADINMISNKAFLYEKGATAPLKISIK